jgi:hypothetical protein
MLTTTNGETTGAITRGVNMNEIWKRIPSWPGYEVSDLGNVRSLTRVVWNPGGRVPHWMFIPAKTKRINLKTIYPTVRLSKNGCKTTCPVQWLVAEAFLGPRPYKADTRHLDGNRKNNRLSNITYGTRRENMQDGVRHGTSPKGLRNPVAKLNPKIVIAIRRRRSNKEKIRVIAADYGISEGLVSMVANRKLWGHVC